MIQDESTPKIFCSITHGLYSPWVDILHDGQVPTWLCNPELPNFSINHFHGIPGGKSVMNFDRLHERIRWTNRWVAAPLRILDNLCGFPIRNYIPTQKNSNHLHLQHPVTQINFLDIYATMKWKDLSILDYFLRNSDCDFIFMTTTSSYIRPRKLMEIVSSLPRQGVYAGAVAYEGANFAAGNNRLFSRDTAEAIVTFRRKLACGTIEDLAIGNLCAEIGFKLIELPKINISSMDELHSLSDKDLESNFHFRLKSGTIDDRNDVPIMRELHRRVRLIDGI